MKKNAVIDYDKLYQDLLKINTLPIYKKVEAVEEEITCTSSNVSTHQRYIMNADVKNLGAQLAHYFTVSYKNFEFTSFYDKDFISAAKTLIKSYDEFKKFLENVDITIEEFIKMMGILSPQVFTSNLVKFIQKYYINPEKTR